MERFGLVTTREPLKLRLLVLPFVCALILTYFAFSAVGGEQSLENWRALSVELETLNSDLATVREERERMEHHVALLRPESLDPDLLDERARATLGIARPDELTIYRDLR